MRVCDADGAVLGAGVLLGTRHVLTCAHVLFPSDDLGTEDTPPDINVVIDFVGLRKVSSARARVATDGWVPPDDVEDAKKDQQAVARHQSSWDVCLLLGYGVG